VVDIITELKEYGVSVSVCDPLADAEAVKHEYGLDLVTYSPGLKMDAVILAVCHAAFKKQLSVESLKKHLSGNGSSGVVVDVKGLYEPSAFAGTGLLYWRL
jgi:UDP-N-acetyl-D-galactosamine dehydrogenase